MQSSQKRKILPPRLQEDDVVGSIKLTKPTTVSHKVNIQFWGESQPAVLYTSQTNPIAQEYEIKCPITIFEKYVLDMKRNFKVEVEGLGLVHIDLTNYLKKNISITSKTLFDHFKGYFEVIGKNGKKVASLQLQFCANFNPEIALQQLDQQQLDQQACPAQKAGLCLCNGVCKCKPDTVTALDVIAVQKPQLFREFYQQFKERTSPKRESIKPIMDNRIPNSLNFEPNRQAFNANKYFEPVPVIAPKVNQNFPTVQKILTYSNLRLKKQQSEQLQQEQSKPISIKDKISKGLLTPPNNEPKSFNNITPIDKLESKNNQIPFIKKNSKEVTIRDNLTKRQEKQGNVSILPVAQDQKINASISEVSQVQKLDQSVSVDAHRQILSRVVNLNAELQKERKNSPIKTPLQQKYQQKIQLQPQPIKQYGPLHPPAMLPNYNKRKPSSLLLNMVIQLPVHAIKLSKSCKFIISYRPYGQKQSIKMGPQFPETLMIMFPVGQPQILKMNKIPFILQFWSATDGQLLGVLKLSLAKIQQGFLLEGRLNELAIKTSLLPTVIYKSNHPIISLTDKITGDCFISAHIGTTSQVQSYLNAPHQLQYTTKLAQQQKFIPQPTKPSSNQVPDKQKRRQGTFIDFTKLLQLIDTTSNETNIQYLMDFMQLKTSTHQQFQSFLNQMEFVGGNFFSLLDQDGKFTCKQLSNCFEDYKNVKQRINTNASNILKDLSKDQITQIMAKIKEKSNFGVLSKKDLDEIFVDGRYGYVLSLLDNIVESDILLEWIGSKGKKPLKKINMIEEKELFEAVKFIFVSQCKDRMNAIQQFLTHSQMSNEVNIYKIKQRFIGANKRPFSLWFWMILSKSIGRLFDQDSGDLKNINTTLLFNWMVLQNKNNPHQNNVPSKDSDISDDKPIDRLEEAQVHQEPIKQPQIQQINQIIQIKRQKIPEQKPKIEVPKPQSQKQQHIYEHIFVVTLQQLHLDDDITGQCTVFYRFPFQQQQITSRRFQLLRDKHKYKLHCAGTHKFTITQQIHQYLGQSTLGVRVYIGKDNQLYGDLHSEELVADGAQLRVIPLFTNSRQGIAGKIKLKIQYSSVRTEQHHLGKQTIKDVYLPKNGYLNFGMNTSVDQTRIRQQFHIKEQFYLQMSLDIFGQNPSLAPHYPPFISKLYSDFTSPMFINGSFKINLSHHILQHFRNGSCVARLVLVYYAKQKGNYQRKQLLMAHFKAPLLSIIRQDGLKGDYAFKNKLGMFVSLAQCSIKYQKQAKSPIESPNTNSDPSRNSYWIVVQFTEVINFQGDLGWLKFEIINKGKRYSTDKTAIRQTGTFELQQRCLMLQLGQQQFSITKILPISLTTASEHFGMDINLRPISKNLMKHKYSASSQYFIVVDDRSISRKIRIGAKVYAFRGQAALGNFVQAFSKNCTREDTQFNQREQSYQQCLDKFRKRIKLSAKTFQQSISMIVDKRKKQKLPSIFFSSKILPNLQLTPILTFNQSDLEVMAEELPSEVDTHLFLEHIEHSGVKFINLRAQFLERYSFNKLNEERLDQNVQYLGLHHELDLLVFLCKVKIEQHTKNDYQIAKKEENNSKHVRISIIRGYNFHLLYNGIKPNARVRLPEIGLETEVISRSSEPIFNEHINFQVKNKEYTKIQVQAYHEAGQDMEQILIGEGVLSMAQSLRNSQIPNNKVYRVVLSSVMSNKMQAALDIKVEIISKKQAIAERSYSELDESIGDSRIEQAMDRVRKVNDFKKRAQLFQSSDED